ncbi:MAG: hypothetical protein ACYTGX_17040, partial [Planctomycetota bacterium]
PNMEQARDVLREADDWTAQLLWAMWAHGGDLEGPQPEFIAAYDRALRGVGGRAACLGDGPRLAGGADPSRAAAA